MTDIITELSALTMGYQRIVKEALDAHHLNDLISRAHAAGVTASIVSDTATKRYSYAFELPAPPTGGNVVVNLNMGAKDNATFSVDTIQEWIASGYSDAIRAIQQIDRNKLSK